MVEYSLPAAQVPKNAQVTKSLTFRIVNTTPAKGSTIDTIIHSTTVKCGPFKDMLWPTVNTTPVKGPTIDYVIRSTALTGIVNTTSAKGSAIDAVIHITVVKRLPFKDMPRATDFPVRIANTTSVKVPDIVSYTALP